MKKGKKAQFYLIFAIIIMGLVSGVLALKNYSLREDTLGIKKIKQELQIESRHVLDYISLNGENLENGQPVLENFTQEFSDYAKGYEIIYITGGLTPDVYKYVGGEREDFTEGENYHIEGTELTINFNNASYLFKLKEGKNFYFIISKQEKGGMYVETNSE